MPYFHLLFSSRCRRFDVNDLRSKLKTSLATIFQQHEKNIVLRLDVDVNASRLITGHIVSFLKPKHKKAAKEKENMLIARRAIRRMIIDFGIVDNEKDIKLVDEKTENNKFIDWREDYKLMNEMTIWHQNQMKTCSVYSTTDLLTCSYMVSHSKSEKLDSYACSPQELIQWVKPKFPEEYEIDDWKESGGHTKNNLEYAKRYGVSILKNYPVDTPKSSSFEEMNETVGREKIYIDDHSKIENDNKKLLFFEVLSKGPVVGSFEICDGVNCRCPKFSHHDGEEVYTLEADHVQKKTRHAMLIVGLGNKDGIDYFIVKNSHGIKWGNDGYGHMDVKLCKKMYFVSGVRKSIEAAAVAK